MRGRAVTSGVEAATKAAAAMAVTFALSVGGALSKGFGASVGHRQKISESSRFQTGFLGFFSSNLNKSQVVVAVALTRFTSGSVATYSLISDFLSGEEIGRISTGTVRLVVTYKEKGEAKETC